MSKQDREELWPTCLTLIKRRSLEQFIYTGYIGYIGLTTQVKKVCSQERLE